MRAPHPAIVERNARAGTVESGAPINKQYRVVTLNADAVVGLCKAGAAD
jgi:hypothetical protein